LWGIDQCGSVKSCAGIGRGGRGRQQCSRVVIIRRRLPALLRLRFPLRYAGHCSPLENGNYTPSEYTTVCRTGTSLPTGLVAPQREFPGGLPGSACAIPSEAVPQAERGISRGLLLNLDPRARFLATPMKAQGFGMTPRRRDCSTYSAAISASACDKTVQYREGAAVGRKPIGNLAVILSLKNCQISIFTRLNRTLAMLHSQRPRAVYGRGRNRFRWRHFHVRTCQR